MYLLEWQHPDLTLLVTLLLSQIPVRNWQWCLLQLILWVEHL